MAQETAPAPKGSKSSLVVVIVAVLALAGGAGGAAFYLKANPGAAAAAPTRPPDPGVAPLEPFVVNLADAGGHRFLRLTIALVLESKEAAKDFDGNDIGKMRVRSGLLELLTVQNAEHLVTPEGKAELKKAIAERAGHALEHVKVSDVLFTEFVVQF